MLSILIPTFNDAKYITKAIASSLALKYVSEIIIIDDCSEDHTEILIKELKKKNNIIKYFKNKENLGVGKSLIKALKKSKYAYVLMLNSDDFFIPNGVDKLLDYMITNQLDLAYGKMAIQKKNQIFRFKHPGYFSQSYVGERDEFIDLLIYDMYMPSFGTIIKKSILEDFYNMRYIKKLDDEFGESFKAHDYDLFLNLSKKGIKIGFLNEFVCVWKPSEDSQSGSSYFNSGCAAAESAFLFNRYNDKNLIKTSDVKKKIFHRVYQKYVNAKVKKNLYNNHFKKFIKLLDI